MGPAAPGPNTPRLPWTQRHHDPQKFNPVTVCAEEHHILALEHGCCDPVDSRHHAAGPSVIGGIRHGLLDQRTKKTNVQPPHEHILILALDRVVAAIDHDGDAVGVRLGVLPGPDPNVGSHPRRKVKCQHGHGLLQ